MEAAPKQIEDYGQRMCEALETLGASGSLNISYLPDFEQFALICNLDTLAIIVTTLVLKADEYKTTESNEEGH